MNYRFKFYLNASHAIYSNGVIGQSHPHTWEITLDVIKARQDFVQFDVIEKNVEGYFEKYQDGNLNKIPPFDAINPTLENITDYFKKNLFNILAKMGWLLIKIEVSETPARSYIIETDAEIDSLLSEKTTEERTINNAVDEKIEMILSQS